jgi:CRISPR-associated protein Cas2
MTDRQFIVVVYDISSDKRRTKLHDTLLNYGTPVQYSVFECLLAPEQLNKMKQAVQRVIRPRKDRVRYYFLCQACLAKTEVTSGPEVLEETDVIVV